MRLLLVILATTARAMAASCLPVENDRITAGDLAVVLPELRAVKPETMFGYAPQPGAIRVIPAEEIRRFADVNGVVVETPSEVCVEYPARPLEAAQVLDAITEVLGTYVRVELVDFTRNPVPRGRVVFDRATLVLPVQPGSEPLLWRGHVEYGAHRRALIWARARVTQTQRELVAARDLRAGETLAAADVRVETRDVPLSKNSALRDISEAEGMTTRRVISAGTAIRAEWLKAAEVVRRGDQVPVTVVSAAAVLRLHARAESSARAGERVSLINTATGKRFEARVDRRGEAIVQVGGDAK